MALTNPVLSAAHHVPTRSLFVARDGAYFSVSGGERVDLTTRGPLRRVLRAVVQAHRERPRRTLSVNEVFDAAWSGEKAEAEQRAGRVYSAISKLRRMGLRDVLVRAEDGYRLDPRVCVIEETPLLSRREPATVIHRELSIARLAS
ncbi:MAG TPA: hypothetical protein VLT33_17080 [Labilithrix sp.]|nr:hypothetical protein [Labilithrix sp.]